jgi:hypothetical protein
VISDANIWMIIVIFQSGIVEVTQREALRRMEEAAPRTARGGAALSAPSGMPFSEALYVQGAVDKLGQFLDQGI